MTLRIEQYESIAYGPALDRQMVLHGQRVADLIPDTVMLLEHDPPVFTLGRQGNTAHLLVGEEQRRQRGIELYHIDRGGDITFHGPGQLVAYFIVAVGAGKHTKDLIWRCEQCLMDTAAAFGVIARRDPRYPGLWVGERKVGAVGLRIESGVTRHGIALNINTDLSFFRLINPCGITDYGVTSLAQETGAPLSMARSREAMAAAVEAHFGGGDRRR